MCKTGDLVVMVVDADRQELQRSCDALGNLGLDREKILCVSSYQDALETLKSENDIDIVLADFEIENGKDLGLLLCVSIKQRLLGMLVILTSREYCCSVVLESFKSGAEDILDLKREGEIESLMEKWIDLAKQRNITREILYGPKSE